MKLMPCMIAVMAGLAGLGHSQTPDGDMDARSIVLPQRRVIPPVNRTVRQPVTLEKVNALVRVNGRSAQTTLELSVHNGGNVPTEAELVLPVPEGVVVKGFYYGAG